MILPRSYLPPKALLIETEGMKGEADFCWFAITLPTWMFCALGMAVARAAASLDARPILLVKDLEPSSSLVVFMMFEEDLIFS